MATVAKLKPRKYRVYKTKPGPKPGKRQEKAKSSARLMARKNLTCADWLEVIAFHDAHSDMSQGEIVKFFSSRFERALFFTQSSLCRNLARRKLLQERADANPRGLSSKRPHAVTHPYVEDALVLWQKSMEAKNELVTGAMLIAKRTRFEEAFNIPENERLKSTGWVAPFMKTYGIKGIRRHGEAASVNLDQVKEERKRVAKILKEYAISDQFNFDETALYPFAPPDRGLAAKQMSGKKASKFRVTIGLACNADGTEKEMPFFIGKSRMPRCFKNVEPARRGFYYRSNKTAWMTSALFEETYKISRWVKSFDLKMRRQGRKVILLIDNFSGHSIAYQPQNVRIEFFSPNMTPFVQPLDAGVIRTFKALYRHDFCLRAVDLDEAGETDIYKLDLLEAMFMVKAAWEKVKPSTLVNCWRHTGIQEVVCMPTFQQQEVPATQHPSAWEILRDYAHGVIATVPEVENRLQELLGPAFSLEDWSGAIAAILHTEDDTVAAVEVYEQLSHKALGHKPANSPAALTPTPTPIPTLTPTPTPTPTLTPTPAPGHAYLNVLPELSQLKLAETDLLASVKELGKRHRIIGTPLTLEDLLNPIEEQKRYCSTEHFEGGVLEIVEEVRRRRETGMTLDSESESESESESDNRPPVKKLTLHEGQELCSALEGLALDHAGIETALNLATSLRKFRGELFRKELLTSKQKTLQDMWGRN